MTAAKVTVPQAKSVPYGAGRPRRPTAAAVPRALHPPTRRYGPRRAAPGRIEPHRANAAAHRAAYAQIQPRLGIAFVSADQPAAVVHLRGT